MSKRFILILFILFLLECSEPLKVKIEIPVESQINLSDFQEVIITNFFVPGSPQEFQAGREIANYLVNEFKSQFSTNARLKEIKMDNEDKIFSDKEFWKKTAESSKALIITGTATMKEEKRNIVQESSPYTTLPQRRIVQMKFFVLDLKIFLIDSSSGLTLSSKKFKEEKGYEDPNTPFEKGFMDIMQRIASRYLKELFQKKVEEERYIIY